MQKSQASGRPGDYFFFYRGAWYLWGFTAELA